MQRRALLIGIDDYPYAPLTGCVADARRLQQVLSRHEDGSPNFDCRTILLERGQGKTLTQAALREALSAHFSADADLALLHFSGHGLFTDLGGYLATTDARRYDEGLATRDLLTLANDSAVPEIVITLDCCHSGALGHVGGTQRDHASLREGVALLTASGESQSSLESDGGGLFTTLMVAALGGQAADLFGHVTIAGVYAHLDPYLGAWSQRPRMRANLKRLTPLRRCRPALELALLRKLTTYFPTADATFALDPSYEPSVEPRAPAHEQIFAELQQLSRHSIVEPIGHRHMYHAAIHSGGCRLSAVGQHCWQLARSGRI